MASRRNAFAEDLGRPPETGRRPQSGTSTLDRCLPPAASSEGETDGRRRVWRLPAIDSSVTSLRRGLSDFLRGADLSGDERYDLLLAACEAASNAVEHARDPSEPFFDVRTDIGEAGVTIVVCDHGQWREKAPGAHRGRGLAMMWILADTRVTTGSHGTTVTIRSSPRHGRMPVPSHGERGGADGSRCSSSGLRGSRAARAGEVHMASRAVTEILSAVWAGARGDEGLPESLVRLCARTLPVTGVGLALMTDEGPAGTVAASDDGAQQLEELQFDLGQGPCVDASRTGRPVLAPDLADTSPRTWPQFGAGADAAGLRAVFAFPLQVGGIRLGVLGLYRDTAGELTRKELADALSFADAATQLLLDLQAQDTTPQDTARGIPAHFLAVLDDRAEVHQATGVVSVRAGVSLAQALALLRAQAYAEERPIGDLARDVLDGVVQLGEDDGHQ